MRFRRLLSVDLHRGIEPVLGMVAVAQGQIPGLQLPAPFFAVVKLREGRGAGWGSRIPRSENPGLGHPTEDPACAAVFHLL
jgi:hypothetical protein